MVKLTLHGVDTLTAFSSSHSLCFQLFKGQKVFFSKKDLGGGKNHFSLLFLSFEGFPYTETRVYRDKELENIDCYWRVWKKIKHNMVNIYIFFDWNYVWQSHYPGINLWTDCVLLFTIGIGLGPTRDWKPTTQLLNLAPSNLDWLKRHNVSASPRALWLFIP